MGQGSQDVKISHPDRSKVPSFAAAIRIAVTSAWAVGSQASVTPLLPSATISPSRAMTAPNGPPPRSRLSLESRMARRISSFLSIVFPGWHDCEERMVRLAGIEPTTFSSGG